MNTLRRFGLSLAVVLFSACASLLVISTSLYAVFATPQPLKQALGTSGMYDAIVQDTLHQQPDGPVLQQTDAGITSAFEKAFSPTFLQDSFEKVIDSVYAWAGGETATLAFSIDLTPVKKNFADNVAIYIQQKLSTLPVCVQVITPPASIDGLLALTCLPQGVVPASVADTARQEILRSGLFADSPTIDAANLKDEQGRAITEQLAFVPQIHTYYTIALFALPILLPLMALAIIYLSATKRAGLRRVGWLLISAGVTYLVIAATCIWLLHTGAALLDTATSITAAIRNGLVTTAEMLLVDLRVWWFGFGAGYTVVGTGVLVALKLRPPRPKITIVPTQPHTVDTPVDKNML